MSPRWFTAGMALAALVGTGAGAEEWRTVFEDNYERAEPGPLYTGGDRAGELRIENGRLLLIGSGRSTLIDRPFAMDVRLEFDTEAWKERAPCDLSVLLNSGSYLLGFGARSNMANHLVGPGIRQVDLDPPFVIELGRKYHMVAQREGRRITYTVNGSKILDATSDELVGGQSFNKVGFITWSGMYVDNLRISERVPPHPDTPVYIESVPGLPLEREGRKLAVDQGEPPADAKAAIAAFNEGDLGKAKSLFENVRDATWRLAGLAYVYGDINYIERPAYGNLGESTDYGELGAFAEQWADAVTEYPDNETLQAYLPAARSFGKLVLSRQGGVDARILVDLGPKGNPFYHKAKLFQARYIYWSGMEGANETAKGQARQSMRELLEIWPDNRVLREYVGEPVPWGEELNADTSNDPAWAAYLREAYAREIAVMERMVELRQRPEGQFGGGWGDDVEMMRLWVPIAAISNCSTRILDSIALLSDGIWEHESVNGYNEGISDVEHSSEPTADTFPTMLLLRHGDPKYYEYNLASCRTIRDVMMGIDKKGYPRFKSTEIGARGANEQIIGGGDTGYHARAMKHFMWLAWYGNAEARDWYVRWVDGWRNATMASAPDKPEGLVPPTLWYPSGDWNPPNGEPWYSPKAENYYGIGGLPIMSHQTFLAAYALSGDRKFLRPVQRMMDLSTYGPYKHTGAQPPDPKGFLDMIVGHSACQVTALYRFLTGERVYDEYTRRFGTGPQVYQINQDLDAYISRIEKAAKSLRHNLWYYTTEVESTDRLHLPAVPEVWGAYTGAVTTTVDAEWPTMGVTWETPDANFAALVTENVPTRLRVKLYSFWDKPVEIGAKFWQLLPGEYLIVQGKEEPGEQSFQKRYAWSEPQRVTITHQGQRVPLRLPPRTEWVVDVRLDRELSAPTEAPDLAITTSDTRFEQNRLTVRVHNLGSTLASGIKVALRAGGDTGTNRPVVQTIAHLGPPNDFKPAVAEVSFDLPAGRTTSGWRVSVDPDNELFELNEQNNEITLTR